MVFKETSGGLLSHLRLLFGQILTVNPIMGWRTYSACPC